MLYTCGRVHVSLIFSFSTSFYYFYAYWRSNLLSSPTPQPNSLLLIQSLNEYPFSHWEELIHHLGSSQHFAYGEFRFSLPYYPTSPTLLHNHRLSFYIFPSVVRQWWRQMWRTPCWLCRRSTSRRERRLRKHWGQHCSSVLCCRIPPARWGEWSLKR